MPKYAIAREQFSPSSLSRESIASSVISDLPKSKKIINEFDNY